MIELDLIQGTPQWHKHRATARNASEAPAVLGDSNYVTRTQLLDRMVTGVPPEVSPWQQKIFDDGHAVEPVLRAYAEDVIGDELLPLCAMDDDKYLSCSFDGVTFDRATIAEYKQVNKSKMESIEAGHLPATDRWQVIQGFAVNDQAERCIYVCGDGTAANTRHLIVQRSSVLGEIDRLYAGWRQLDEDRKTHKPREATAEAVGSEPQTLPALSIQVRGEVVTSNLAAFRQQALAVLANINTNLKTDQDFADADATVKWCDGVEQRIAATKAQVIGQMADVDAALKVLDDVSGETRRLRLSLTNTIKAEKQRRKEQLIAAGVQRLHDHVSTLNEELGEYGMPTMMDWPRRVGDQIKGKSSVANMEAAIDEFVAQQRLALSESAARVRANVKLLESMDERFAALFPDRVSLAHEKSQDDLMNLIRARVAEHQEAEAQARAKQEREQHENDTRARAAAGNDPANAIGDAWPDDDSAASAEHATGSGEATHGAQQAAPVDAQEAIPAAAVDEQPGFSTVIVPAKAVDPTLSLGEISERLAPVSASQAMMKHFGMSGVRDKGAVRYDEAQFEALCRLLIEHVTEVLDDYTSAGG